MTSIKVFIIPEYLLLSWWSEFFLAIYKHIAVSFGHALDKDISVLLAQVCRISKSCWLKHQNRGRSQRTLFFDTSLKVALELFLTWGMWCCGWLWWIFGNQSLQKYHLPLTNSSLQSVQHMCVHPACQMEEWCVFPDRWRPRSTATSAGSWNVCAAVRCGSSSRWISSSSSKRRPCSSRHSSSTG